MLPVGFRFEIIVRIYSEVSKVLASATAQEKKILDCLPSTVSLEILPRIPSRVSNINFLKTASKNAEMLEE